MASIPAWTNPAGILCTSFFYFHTFSAFTAASTSSFRNGDALIWHLKAVKYR